MLKYLTDGRNIEGLPIDEIKCLGRKSKDAIEFSMNPKDLTKRIIFFELKVIIKETVK